MKLWIALLLVAAPCAAQSGPPPFLPGQLPFRVARDTRYLANSFWEQKVWDAARQMMAEAVTANQERALCLYGDLHWLQGGGEMQLHLTEALQPAIQFADSIRINLQCPNNPFFVGTIHTHLQVPEGRCQPSDRNFGSLLWREESLVEYIACIDGQLFWEWKDGRWGMTTWK